MGSTRERARAKRGDISTRSFRICYGTSEVITAVYGLKESDYERTRLLGKSGSRVLGISRRWKQKMAGHPRDKCRMNWMIVLDYLMMLAGCRSGPRCLGVERCGVEHGVYLESEKVLYRVRRMHLDRKVIKQLHKNYRRLLLSSFYYCDTLLRLFGSRCTAVRRYGFCVTIDHSALGSATDTTKTTAISVRILNEY